MSAEEFWHGEPRLAASYRAADEIRRESRYLAEWRAGAYAYEALVSASPAFHEFSKGVQHAYPAKPLFAVPGRGPTKEAEARAGMEDMLARFEAAASGINRAMRAPRGREGRSPREEPKGA